MSWRSIIITKPTKLSLENRQLKITQDEEWSIPMEDISSVVLETPQVSITAKLISSFAENKVILYSCDEKHIPNGIFTPFNSHSRQLKVLKQQIGLTEAFKKRCWQKIIKQKIINQAKVLEYVDNIDMSKYLSKIANEVDSGDTKNKEGFVAKTYFPILFNSNFVRINEDIHNTCLNYGYSIIRGAIARTIVAYGFIPAIGLHHKSELNNYNLADDFIEPFRPIVDLYVKQNIKEDMDFDKNIRACLVNLLNMNVIIKDKEHSVCNAIEVMISSFTSAVQNKNYELLELPIIIPLEVHNYE